jgi:hypothetical protein
VNLHALRFAHARVAIWIKATGRNGRDIGVHLWELEPSPYPTDQETRQPWQGLHWNPRRFSWRPYFQPLHNFMRGGYVRPLCGHRSGSRSPHTNVAYSAGTCIGCLQAARRSGIVPLTYSQATEQSPLTEQLTAEEAAWIAAGRPATWPPSS